MRRGIEAESGNQGVHDVANVGIVTCRHAVTIQGDLFAVEHGACETMNGQVGPLAWTIHGEKSQAQYRDAVEMGVGMADQLPGPLGGSVWRDRSVGAIIFAERDARPYTIDRRRAAEEKTPYMILSAQL